MVVEHRLRPTAGQATSCVSESFVQDATHPGTAGDSVAPVVQAYHQAFIRSTAMWSGRQQGGIGGSYT